MLVKARRRERRGELHPQRAQAGAEHTGAPAHVGERHQAPAVRGRGGAETRAVGAAAVHGLCGARAIIEGTNK